MSVGTLADWLTAQGFVEGDTGVIGDVVHIRALLIEAARKGRAVSYSELLGLLGLRFSRPKMRALCRTLDAIDREAKVRCEPELAVLVVRESDRLPGHGWWTDSAAGRNYNGRWAGEEARTLVDRLQTDAFAYWRSVVSPAK